MAVWGIIISGVAALVYFASSLPDRGFARIQRRINAPGIGPDRIRSWALGVLKQQTAVFANTNSVAIPISAIPQWIASIGDPFPLHLCTASSVASSRGYSVTVAWFWGGESGVILVIGETNFVFSDFSPQEIQVRALAPGIYAAAD